MPCGRTGSMATLAVVIAVAAASSVAAAPTAVDLQLSVGASGTLPQNVPPTIPGGTVNLASLNFYVFVDIALITPQPAKAKVRVELSDGLRWGADDPDTTEGCTSTPTTGECTLDLQPVTGGSESGWYWEVVAAQAGTYTWKGEIVESSDTDPDTTNNSSQITLVVSTGGGTGGGGGGSGGSGGGGSATAVASAAKLTPAKPRAGSAVVASVRVRAAGAPVRPTRIACAATIGAAKLKGTPRAASGSAACTFRTPRAAKGKLLKGSVAFTARGKRFTKRFSARLG